MPAQKRPSLTPPWSAPPAPRDVWRWVLEAVAEGHTHRAIAAALRIPRARVSSMARTRVLTDFVRKLIGDGRLSPRHGEVLLLAPEADRDELARKACSFRWSVMTLRDKIRRGNEPDAKTAPLQRDPNVVALEEELSALLACPVAIVANDGEAGGILQIRFFDNDTLDGVLQRMRLRPAGW